MAEIDSIAAQSPDSHKNKVWAREDHISHDGAEKTVTVADFLELQKLRQESGIFSSTRKAQSVASSSRVEVV
jgi:hypothetical protein